MLTAEQKKFYQENGFIVLDNIFTTEEIEECSKEYDEVFDRHSKDDLEATWKGDWKEDTKQSTTVKSIHNLQFHSAIFTRMLLNKSMLDALEDIMETPNILLHHTKAHVKPPGKGSPFPTHQDYHYFPFKNHSMVAVFIHLDDTTPENGGLAVFPGSHKLGPLEDKGAHIGTHHYVDQDEFALEKAEPVFAKKGQVVIFSYLLVHGSYLNTSAVPRRMLLVQLMSADDDPIKEVHKSPAQGLVLRGKNVRRDANIHKRTEA